MRVSCISAGGSDGAEHHVLFQGLVYQIPSVDFGDGLQLK